MRQLTLRVPDHLVAALKDEAGRQGESVNAYVTTVLSAAVDPDLEDDDAQRLRARLARAGILEAGSAKAGCRPDRERSRAARRRAASGRALSELVHEGRD